jgi:hypothetical protein
MLRGGQLQELTGVASRRGFFLNLHMTFFGPAQRHLFLRPCVCRLLKPLLWISGSPSYNRLYPSSIENANLPHIASFIMTVDGDDANHTPTPRTHSAQSSLGSIPTGSNSLPSSGTILVVYIVTDVIYPTSDDFNLSKGVFCIDSVHSSKKAANARAKKIIYEGGQIDGGQYKVDVDKIIEDTRKGLFTGIGIGGKGDGREKGCYARKCQVERKMVDEDSEDESGESERDRVDERLGGEWRDHDGDGGGDEDGDGDVEMG